MALPSGFSFEERRVLSEGDDNITVDRLRASNGARVEQLYVRGGEDITKALQRLEVEEEERQQKLREARRQKHLSRPNEVLWSYEIVDAGDDWNGIYSVEKSISYGGYPVYAKKDTTRALWRQELLDGVGWVLGNFDDREPCFGVESNSDSVPGLGWVSFRDESEEKAIPYIEGWRTYDEEALDLKASGNVKFNRKDYESAIECYSKGLVLARQDKIMATLLANRSECLLRLERYVEAQADAGDAVTKQHVPDGLREKCYVRIGRAARALKQYECAKKAYVKALELSPDDPSHAESLRSVKTLCALGHRPELAQARAMLQEWARTGRCCDDEDIGQAAMLRVLRAEPETLLVGILDNTPFSWSLPLARAVVDQQQQMSTKVTHALARAVRAGIASDDAVAVVEAIHILAKARGVASLYFGIGNKLAIPQLCAVATNTPKGLALRPETCRYTKSQWTASQRVAADTLVKQGALPRPVVLSLLRSADEVISSKIAVAAQVDAHPEQDSGACIKLAKEVISTSGEAARYQISDRGNELIFFATGRLLPAAVHKATKALSLAAATDLDEIFFLMTLLHAQPPLAAHALRLLCSVTDFKALASFGAHRPLLGLASPTLTSPVPTQLKQLFRTDIDSVRRAVRFLRCCSKYPGAFDKEPFDEAKAILAIEAMAERAHLDDVAALLYNMCAAQRRRLLLLDLRFFENVLVPAFQSEKRGAESSSLADLLSLALSDNEAACKLASRLQRSRGNHDLLLQLASELAARKRPTNAGSIFVDEQAKLDALSTAKTQYAKLCDLLLSIPSEYRMLEIGTLAGLCPSSVVLEPICAHARRALQNSHNVLDHLSTSDRFNIVALLEAGAGYLDPPDMQDYFAHLQERILEGPAFVLVLCSDADAMLVADDAALAGYCEDDLSATLMLPNQQQLLIFKPIHQALDFPHVIHGECTSGDDSAVQPCPSPIPLTDQLADLD